MSHLHGNPPQGVASKAKLRALTVDVTAERVARIAADAAEAFARTYVDNYIRAEAAINGGRVVYSSATEIRQQQQTGRVIFIEDEDVLIGDSGVTRAPGDKLITSTGTEAAGAAVANSTYYVYRANSKSSYAANLLALCATAPTRLNGILMLGTTGNAIHWRYVGMLRTNAAAQFTPEGVWDEIETFLGNIHLAGGFTLITTSAGAWLRPPGVFDNLQDSQLAAL